MKNIKHAAVVLAVLFVGLSSFKHQSSFQSSGIKNVSTEKNVSTDWLYQWFEYDGYGDPYDPGSYYLTLFPPQCEAASGYLCSIYAEVDFWSAKPTIDGLWELGISSQSFTNLYDGVYGKVRFTE
jgi:hypothetical protein